MHGPKHRKFLRLAGFAGAGAVAFAVDQSVLQGLTLAGMQPQNARLISIFTAIIVAWQLNRRVFESQTGAGIIGQIAELGRYFASALAARAVDYCAFLLILPLLRHMEADHFGPQARLALAAAAGALAGGILGYVLFERLVFGTRAARGKPDGPPS